MDERKGRKAEPSSLDPSPSSPERLDDLAHGPIAAASSRPSFFPEAEQLGKDRVT